MKPVVAPFLAKVTFRLSNFIGMVGEGVIDSAAMDVKILAEMFHGNAGALDMPAGITDTPGGIPLQSLVFKLGFGEPEDKVILVTLVGIFFNAFAYADGEIFFVKVIKYIVAIKL